MTKLDDCLVDAILKHKTKRAKYIIDLKADVTRGWVNGHSSLSAGSVVGDREIVEKILENIKDDDEKRSFVNKRTGFGRTAISYAKNAEIVEILVQNGANPYIEDNEHVNAFFWHAHQRRDDSLNALVRLGFDINELNSMGNTMLIEALQYPGDVGVIERLLEHGADANAKNKKGKTALMRLAEGNYNVQKIVRLLLKYNADVNVEDDTLTTAIECAGNFGNFELARVLIEHGAKEHNSLGHSIYSFGMKESHALEVMRMFEENRRKIKSKVSMQSDFCF